MKLAIIRQKYVSYGGAERFSSGFAQQLAAIGNEVHVFANTWEPLAQSNIHFHKVPTNEINSTKRLLTFAQAVKNMVFAEQFDLVQSHERTVCQDIYRAGDGCHVEWLQRRANYHFVKKLFQTWNPFHREMLKIEEAIFSSGNYKKIVAISEMVKKDIQNHYGVPDSDISVIYNGVELKKFRPENRDIYARSIRKKYVIPENAVVILTVGSGFERKGLEYLIKSLKYLKLKDWRLVVVGKGNWGHYRSMARKRDKDRLIHVPPVEDIEKYYAVADIFVLPSIYEPFGNANLEALASGLPVITSRYSGAAELITHQLNGMVVDEPSDSEEISRQINFLEDASTREAMGRQARRLAEEFPVEKNTEKMIRLYQSLLQDR